MQPPRPLRDPPDRPRPWCWDVIVHSTIVSVCAVAAFWFVGHIIAWIIT